MTAQNEPREVLVERTKLVNASTGEVLGRVGAMDTEGKTTIVCIKCGEEGSVPTEIIPPTLVPHEDGTVAGVCPRCRI